MQHTSFGPVVHRSHAWERPALASGIVFALGQLAAAAYFVSTVAPHLPPLDAPVAQQGAFYSDYTFENALMAYLALLPVPFFLLFLGGLFSALRRLEGGVGVLTATAVGAGIALAMVWPIGIVVADAGQGMAHLGLDPVAVMAFDGAAQLMLALSALPGAVLLITVSTCLRSAGAGPRWLAWFGWCLALVYLAGTATLVNAGIYPLLAVGNLLFDVWVGVVGGILPRRVPAEGSSQLVRQPSLAAS